MNDARGGNPFETSTHSSRIFYDQELSLSQKRARLIRLAEEGDGAARGYLGGLNMIERGALAQTEGLLLAFSEELAESIPQRCQDLEVDRINEQSHLQPWSVEVLGRMASARSGVEVETSVPVDHPEHWPRLGGVDISLDDSDAGRVFLELKCGANKDTLAFCAWDVLKLALLLRVKECAGGYLVAAAPQWAWREPIRGAEFFSHTDWSATAIRERYADWFRAWEKEGYAPVRVPMSGQTNPVTTAEFGVSADPWELRVAQVLVDPDGWTEWAPVLD